MFGAQLLAFFIFIFLCWLIWKAIGKKLVNALVELFLGKEDPEIVREELKEKIESLTQHKEYLESVQHEIGVTDDLNKSQKDLKKAKAKLSKLSKKLGSLDPES